MSVPPGTSRILCRSEGMSTRGLTPALNLQEVDTRVLFHEASRLPLVCKAGNGLETKLIPASILPAVL